MSYSHLLLFGDMNFPHIDWNNISTDKGAGDCNYEFLESIRDCFLDQHIYEPTRGRGETKPSTFLSDLMSVLLLILTLGTHLSIASFSLETNTVHCSRRVSRKRVRLKEMNIAENVKHNPKKFYSYIQSKTKTRTSIPDLYIDSDKKAVTSSDSEKANVLADFFSFHLDNHC
jgi:hypothetical protein